MAVKSFSAASLKGFQQAFKKETSGGFSPSVAIVFSSVDMEPAKIISFLKEKNVAVIGCTTCGEFNYNEREQVISDGGAVCLLLDLAPGTFSLRLFHGAGVSDREVGNQVGQWAAATYPEPALFVLASGLEIDGEELVRGIQETAGEGVTMYGGLAGDDSRFKETLVFSGSEMDNKGVMVMAVDCAEYDVQGIATSGWVGIGADKIVTESAGNIVHTIDNLPALDMYKEYLNVKDEELPEIGVEFPLMVKKPGRPDILRAVLNVDREKKSLIFAGTVPKGSVVTFSSSPGFDILEFTRQRVLDFYTSNKEADFLLLFSCMARHLALGPSISEEIEAAWGKWRVPLAGFFSYGEIGNDANASCDFYNQTFTLVAFRKKHNAR
jgi:hypothetical protein